ncbi:hypothetical protein EJ110_NYTH03560 [Nymphaea thermarum]|nr:hypothetical protein EJ110_NYTH03560 [Nymphaea thermarum]
MEDKEARVTMMHLANLISVPMALHTAVKLDIPDLIWQGGANLPISPSQLASLIRAKFSLATEPDAVNLQRILRLLASHGVFEEVPHDGNPPAKAFRLTNVGRTLVTDYQGLSLGAQEAFKMAHGVAAYEYYVRDSACNSLMQRATSGVSVPFMRALLESYDGFGSKGLKTVVDVGSSTGSCLVMILERYPGLHGINFDLPEVVADAPQYQGVTHVGGNMFESVPAGDAIFMKWILAGFSDEECHKIMENCHRALPEKGKLILCEPVAPENTDDSVRTRALLVGDIFLMAMYKSLHRAESEYRKYGEAAGFSNFRSLDVDPYFTVMEFLK